MINILRIFIFLNNSEYIIENVFRNSLANVILSDSFIYPASSTNACHIKGPIAHIEVHNKTMSPHPENSGLCI